MGYHPNRMHRATPLHPAKIQRISWNWPVFRQIPADKQRKTKRVESCLVLCLDGGSSPPSSTKKDITYDVFFFVELTSFFERLIPLTPDASGITPVGYLAPSSRGPPALIISWYDVFFLCRADVFLRKTDSSYPPMPPASPRWGISLLPVAGLRP